MGTDRVIAGSELPSSPSSMEPSRVEPGLAKQAPNQKAFSQWLDLFRWVAALSVVFAHCENRFLIQLPNLDAAHRTIPLYIFSFFAGFAHPAVMIFFVLSGYLVGGGLWQEAKRFGSFDLSKYLIKRVSRLCIVSYPAFLLIAILNAISVVAFHTAPTSAYVSTFDKFVQPSSLVCNAAFFQTGLCVNYGGDGALWSLYNEFWYYIAWPIFLLGWLIKSPWTRSVVVAAGCILLGSLTMIQSREFSAIGPYMLIWILGVAVAAAKGPVIRSFPVSAAMCLTVLVAIRVLVRRSFGDVHPVAMFLIDFTGSAFFANLLVTIKHHGSLAMPIGRHRNTLLAGFSFSLYCIHTPILNLYAAALRHYSGADPRMVPEHVWQWCVIAGSVVVSVAAAYCFSLLTEAHTARLRDFLNSVLLHARRGRTPAF